MLGQVRREPPPRCDSIDLAGASPESWYRKSSEVVAFEKVWETIPVRNKGVPCQWRSRSARTDWGPEDLPHSTKRGLARFGERVASAKCLEGGHAGETRRRAGVLACRFQIPITLFGHRALGAAPGAHNRK